jgi:hypothetical protein
VYTIGGDRSIFVKFLSNSLLFEISRYIKEVASTLNSTQGKSTMNRNRQNVKQVAETHRANIHKQLMHRLEVARANGNQDLVRILEDEMKQL